jgi:UDP-glucose 4-epimerase
MNILVLGGCGFIGSHLVDRLLSAGHKIRVFDRAPEFFREALDSVEYKYGDFTDLASISDALDDIDIVYHLISTTVPSTSNLNTIADVQTNLVGTLQLLEVMIKKKIPKIIYLSSGGTVYGVPDLVPIPENHALHPICSYGVVKVAIENYLHLYSHLHGLQYVALRVSNPYGERQGHVGVQGVIGTFIRKLLNGEQLEIWGDGKVVRDFIYVDDLVNLCELCVHKNLSGTYNVGSGVGTSVNDLINVMEHISNKVINPLHKQVRTYDVPFVILDISKVCNGFNWSPETTLEKGISKTWSWFESLK